MVVRRRTALAAAGAAAFAGRLSAQGWAWPTRAVRIVIPYAPGGPVEIPGRFLAERLGQPVVVETRPGAGGALGTRQVSPPWGKQAGIFSPRLVQHRGQVQPVGSRILDWMTAWVRQEHGQSGAIRGGYSLPV